MKNQEIANYVPDYKYHNTKTWAIAATGMCIVLLVILAVTFDEVHRLHNYIQNLYPL